MNARSSLPRRNGRTSKPGPSVFVPHSRQIVLPTQRCESVIASAGNGDLGFDESEYIAADVESGERIYRGVCSGLQHRISIVTWIMCLQ